jgi:hypothetical protein
VARKYRVTLPSRISSIGSKAPLYPSPQESNYPKVL